MKTLMYLLTTVALMLALAPAETYGLTVDLQAGNPKNGPNVVGTVDVTRAGDILTVVYSVNPGSAIIETHLHVAETLDQFEDDGATNKKGNPSPGQFDFTVPDFGSDQTTHTYTIDLSTVTPSLAGISPIVVSAHGVVASLASTGACSSCNVDALAMMLPECAGIYADYPGPESFFKIDLVTPTILDGVYKGWCADAFRAFYDIFPPLDPYPVLLYPSYPYSEVPPSIGNTANLPKVNWVVNQGFPGQDAGGSLGIYTVGDVQQAIWKLLNGDFPDGGLYPHGADYSGWGTYAPPSVRAQLIVDAANDYGANFVPSCDDIVLVVLIPVDNCDDRGDPDEFHEQPILIEMENACEDTVWAMGTKFVPDKEKNGKVISDGSWAMWFSFSEAP